MDEFTNISNTSADPLEVGLYSSSVAFDPILSATHTPDSHFQESIGDTLFTSNLDPFYGDLNIAESSAHYDTHTFAFYDDTPLTNNTVADPLTGSSNNTPIVGDPVIMFPPAIDAGSVDFGGPLTDLPETITVEVGEQPVDTKYRFTKPSQLLRDFDSMDEAAIAWYASYWVEIKKATADKKELGEVIIKNSSGKFQFFTPEQPITSDGDATLNPTDKSHGGVRQLEFIKLYPFEGIDVVGLVHTHPFTDKFSEADLTSTARNIHRTYLMSPDGVVKRVDPPSNIKDWSLIQRINYSDEWARGEIADPFENPLASFFEGSQYIVKDKPRPVKIDVIEY